MVLKKCKNCGKVTEMIREKNCDFGYDTTLYKCSLCGWIDKEQINKIHYGNDGIK